MRLPTVLACIVLAAGAFSQSLNVTPNSAVAYGSAIDPTLVYSDIVVWNDTNVSRDVWCTRVEVSVVPGSANAFAWATSVLPGVATDPTPVTIAALGFNMDHQGVYFPNGTAGSSVIRYCFYTLPLMADSVCVTVTYVTTSSGVSELGSRGSLFGYDRATGMLFAMEGLAEAMIIGIMDASGRETARGELRPGGRIELSSLPSGSYVARELRPGGASLHFLR
jgi:hypothetical protein